MSILAVLACSKMPPIKKNAIAFLEYLASPQAQEFFAFGQ